jgi:hypothetical protein
MPSWPGKAPVRRRCQGRGVCVHRSAAESLDRRSRRIRRRIRPGSACRERKRPFHSEPANWIVLLWICACRLGWLIAILDARIVAGDGNDAGLFERVSLGKLKSSAVDFLRERRTTSDGPRSSALTAVLLRLGPMTTPDKGFSCRGVTSSRATIPLIHSGSGRDSWARRRTGSKLRPWPGSRSALSLGDGVWREARDDDSRKYRIRSPWRW